MKEIGGYFELECGKNPLFHKDGIYLNICRSGFRYLIRALDIKKIYVPIFTCNVVYDAIKQEGCEIIPYHLNEDMLPAVAFNPTDYIIYNNYFGVLGKNVAELAKQYPNLIVDNAQAFYSTPKGLADVYSPRKFFGLPDSGILCGRNLPELDLAQGHSIDVSSHLLRRLDYDAQSGYEEFARNDKALEQYSLQYISPLTFALMGNIDYERIKQKRLENFKYLHERLQSVFPFAMSEDDVPMVYPYVVENGRNLRKRLMSEKIYVAKYWPNVQEWCEPGEWEYQLTDIVVPLPIDQRYGIGDMDKIISTVCK